MKFLTAHMLSPRTLVPLCLSMMMFLVGCERVQNQAGENVDATQTCTPLSWEAFYSEPTSFDEREICIEGRVISTILNTNLYPPDAAMFWTAPVILVLDENEAALREVSAKPGDLVSLSGVLAVETSCPIPAFRSQEENHDRDCDAPITIATIELQNAEVLGPDLASADCVTVALDHLLSSPAIFNHQIVCTEGMTVIDDSGTVFALSDPGPNHNSGQQLATYYATRLAGLPHPDEGERVMLSGLLEVDEQCLNEPLERQQDFCEDPIAIHVYSWSSITD